MAWKHPSSILVIAILHLIGGGIGLLFGLCGLGMQAATHGNPAAAFQFTPPNPQQQKQQQKQQQFQKDLQAHMDQEIPYNHVVTYGNMGANLLLDVMLVTAGVGLLYLKSWARTLSLLYAGLSLLEKVGAIAYAAITFPAMASFMERQAQGDPNLAMMGSFAKFGMVFAIIVNLLLAIYPIVVLIVLTRPSVKAAFAGQGAPEVGPEAEERWDEGRFRDDREPPPETYTREP
jgi:hypothetical protein